jgi:hypothetical protein
VSVCECVCVCVCVRMYVCVIYVSVCVCCVCVCMYVFVPMCVRAYICIFWRGRAFLSAFLSFSAPNTCVLFSVFFPKRFSLCVCLPMHLYLLLASLCLPLGPPFCTPYRCHPYICLYILISSSVFCYVLTCSLPCTHEYSNRYFQTFST